jgi:hypothetical protein
MTTNTNETTKRIDELKVGEQVICRDGALLEVLAVEAVGPKSTRISLRGMGPLGVCGGVKRSASLVRVFVQSAAQ